MTDMNLSLIVRLIDQFSQPAKRLRDGARTVANDLRKGFADAIVSGFSTENMDRAIANAETKLGQAKGRLMGALGTAIALAAPVINLGKFETQLVAFGNTAGIFGDDLKAIEDELRTIGPQVNKTASEALSALEYLVGKGLSPQAGIAALRAVGMTATATGSDINDMAASGFAVLDNLGVPAGELQLAFDAMAQSGKAGGFELKGMAQYFPQLTASARALKMQGVPAVAELGAALQIAMKGAGSESEAANNMQNFLSKLTSPEAVKSFADMGVNLEAEFQFAADNGISAFEHMLNVIAGLTDGNQFTLGQLFGDQQVKSFLLPMIADLELFKEIRDQALKADGVNAGDFARVMDTMAEKAKAVVIQLDNLSSNGSVLLEIAKDLASQLGTALAALNAFTEANPELTRALVLTVAGLMALSVATRLAAFAFAGARLPLLGLLNLFLRFDDAGKNVAIGWRLLAGAGGLVTTAFNLIVAAAGVIGSALAGITAPVWIVIALLAAAGFAIWKFWDRISSFVAGMAEGLGGLLAPAVDAVMGAIDGLLNKLAELLGIDPGQVEAFKAAVGDGIRAALDVGPMIDGAKQLFADFWSWLGSFFSQETLSDADKGQMRAAGRKLIEDMWQGIQEMFGQVLEWFAGMPQRIKDAIGQIDIGSLIQWPTPPDWLLWLFGGGGAPDEPAAPSTGAGGPPRPAAAGEFDLLSFVLDKQQSFKAELVDKRPPQVTVHAPITISGVSDPRAAGDAAASRLAGAVSQASAGALHDGMD